MQALKTRVTWILLTLLISVAPPSLATNIQFEDLAGRTITLKQPAQKVILGEGRFLPAMGVVFPEDPLAPVIAMLGNYKRIDPGSYAQYEKLFPKINQIPTIGLQSANSFSVEQAIDLQPDVAIFGLGGQHGPGARNKRIVEQLEAAGITVVFIDFRIKPLEHTVKSIQVLGKLFAKEQQAKQFNEFYQAQLALVSDRLKNRQFTRQNVFIHSRVGLSDQCCETMSHGMMGKFIAFAGGTNIAEPLLPGVAGVLNFEYLLAEQPDIYIATAVGSIQAAKKAPNRIVLGAGVETNIARSSLIHAAQVTGVDELEAVQNKQAYAIWHHFYNTPFNVAAVQQMAKWFHPKLFADLKPQQTLQTLYQDYSPIPLDGVYWVGLND